MLLTDVASIGDVAEPLLCLKDKLASLVFSSSPPSLLRLLLLPHHTKINPATSLRSITGEKFGEKDVYFWN